MTVSLKTATKFFITFNFLIKEIYRETLVEFKEKEFKLLELGSRLQKSYNSN